jgi:hypothetical protein
MVSLLFRNSPLTGSSKQVGWEENRLQLRRICKSSWILFGPIWTTSGRRECVALCGNRMKDPGKIVHVPPRRLSRREEETVDEDVEELL